MLTVTSGTLFICLRNLWIALYRCYPKIDGSIYVFDPRDQLTEDEERSLTDELEVKVTEPFCVLFAILKVLFRLGCWKKCSLITVQLPTRTSKAKFLLVLLISSSRTKIGTWLAGI